MTQTQEQIERLRTLQEISDFWADVAENQLPALAKESTLQEESAAIQSKIDNIDLSGVAKQGDNPEATLSNIIEKLNHMSMSSRTVDGVYSVSEGISLAHLYGNQSESLSVTAIKDTSRGWKCDKAGFLTQIINQFPNVTQIELGCNEFGDVNIFGGNTSWNGELILHNLEIIPGYTVVGNSSSGDTAAPNLTMHVYGLRTSNQGESGCTAFAPNKLYFHDYAYGSIRISGNYSYMNRTTTYLYVGCKGSNGESIILNSSHDNSLIVDIEIREGSCQNITMNKFIGLTEENIINHILKHLKQDEEMCGSGVTITLGATNLAKLTSEEAVALLDSLTNTYGYTFA